MRYHCTCSILWSVVLVLVMVVVVTCGKNGVRAESRGTSSSGKNIPCPGSPAGIHAKCQMVVQFPSSSSSSSSSDCTMVKEEILHRILGDNGWIDPHNHGQYKLLKHENANDTTNENEGEVDDGMILASRRTGNDKYTDLMLLTFLKKQQEGIEGGGGACIVQACSESQVTSVIDYSTNYCNLHNLFCSSQDGCTVVEHDLLQYQEQYKSCSQRDVSQCGTSNPSSTVSTAL
jgi:hypothetical protein